MTTPDLSSNDRYRRHKPRHFQSWSWLLASFLAIGFAGFTPAQTMRAESSDQRLKIVFEVTSGTSVAHGMFVTDLEGLQRNFSDMADFAVVASAEGVAMLRAADNPLQARLAKLADRGVDFMVCTQGLDEMEMDASALLGFARTIRSGSAEIKKLSEQGWTLVGDGESYVSNL